MYKRQVEYASPESKNEALAFASALRATRAVDAASPLQDAIYVERLSRLLPTFTISPRVSDDVVFGAWFTGGVPVSIEAFRRIRSLSPWLGAKDVYKRQITSRCATRSCLSSVSPPRPRSIR